MSNLVEVFGRLHPVLNHAPIGLLIGLLAIEIVSGAIASPLPRRVITGVVWITAIAAVLAALSGFVLSRETQYQGETVILHMRLGIAIAAMSVVLAAIHLRAREGTRGTALATYRALLVVTVLLLLPAGHLGGTITHGEGFLTAPLRTGATVEAAERVVRGEAGNVGQPPDFARDVAPILADRCASCHGTSKKKGGLSLASLEAVLAGGRDGPVIVAGKPEESELIRRIRLPVDDEDHMPPPTKPQPTAAEIEVIAAWIAAAPPPVEPPAAVEPEPEEPTAVEASLAKLREELVHVEPVEEGSTLYWVDFAARATTIGDAEVRALLEPVLESVAELGLARTKVTDETVRLAARMPNLVRLDLRGTPVTDAGIAALAGHPSLAELVIPSTGLTDGAVAHLLKIPNLRKVYLWNSGITIQGIADLRLKREKLVIEAGDAGEARPLESEAPVEVAKPPAAGAAPAPVNTACPVSGKPVDPAYQVVYRGRVIGFCCPNCPTTFWADPEKYAPK